MLRAVGCSIHYQGSGFAIGRNSSGPACGLGSSLASWLALMPRPQTGPELAVQVIWPVVAAGSQSGPRLGDRLRSSSECRYLLSSRAAHRPLGDLTWRLLGLC
jgi:hypothetical protein